MKILGLSHITFANVNVENIGNSATSIVSYPKVKNNSKKEIFQKKRRKYHDIHIFDIGINIEIVNYSGVNERIPFASIFHYYKESPNHIFSANFTRNFFDLIQMLDIHAVRINSSAIQVKQLSPRRVVVLNSNTNLGTMNKHLDDSGLVALSFYVNSLVEKTFLPNFINGEEIIWSDLIELSLGSENFLIRFAQIGGINIEFISRKKNY